MTTLLLGRRWYMVLPFWDVGLEWGSAAGLISFYVIILIAACIKLKGLEEVQAIANSVDTLGT
jgi:hypothetical protein